MRALGNIDALCILFYSKKIIIDVPILPHFDRAVELAAAIKAGPQQPKRTLFERIH
jgi:hypothetical protein